MTYEDLIVAIDATAPQMGNCALRLLLRLIAIAIQQGTNQVRASDRWIGTQLGFSNDGVTAAKRGLAGIVQVTAARGSVTTFDLPADWFAPQRSLFAPETALVNRAPRTAQQGTTALVNGAPAPFLAGQTALVNGADSTAEQGSSPANQGTLHRSAGQGAPLSRAPATQNQQDGGALSRSKIELGDSVVVRDFVFSIFSKRVLPPEQRPAATILAPRLQHVLHTAGQVEKAKILPDDGLLAQCLTIADVGKLFAALDLAKQRGGKPKGYGWFIPIFLEAVHGIPREVTSVLRDEYRSAHQRKQPGRAEPLPFPAQITNQLVSGVKRLK